MPGGPDLAACFFTYIAGQEPAYVRTSLFATDAPDDIFIGDDVFLVGRFVDYDGKETNRPALRFGSVSMLHAPIKQETKSESPSHIIDMRVRTGFSGSPVYAYRSHGTISQNRFDGGSFGANAPKMSKRNWGDGTQTMLKLVGIQWGQFRETWKLNDGTHGLSAGSPQISEGAYVEGFSGMVCVVPASQILRLLNVPALKFMVSETSDIASISRSTAAAEASITIGADGAISFN